MKPPSASPVGRAWRSLRLGGLILFALVVYAYSFQVTKVNLEETRSENRQKQLVRILRALARPDILQFPREDVTISAPFYMPCPPTDIEQREIHPRQAYILVTPNCVAPGGEIQVEGVNLEPNAEARVFLVPPSGVNLRLETFTTDETGHFRVVVDLPERSSDQVQAISVITRQTVGSPRLTRNAYDTWDKIIETVFLALLATTLGTLIAVPLSFLAARNLMKGITASVLALSLSILAAPLGLVMGARIAAYVADWATSISSSSFATLAGAIIAPMAAWVAARWALPQVDAAPPRLLVRLARGLVLIGASLAAIFGLGLTSEVLADGGAALERFLPGLDFVGKFVGDLGEILYILLAGIAGLVTAGVLTSLAGRLARILSGRLPSFPLRSVEWIVAAAAGAALFAMVGAGLDWLYQSGNQTLTLYGPAGVGGAAGLGLSLRYGGRETLPLGLVIYNIARTVFNGLRAIEALIMVIVFTVWVGIGPFAGVLALSLHSIAAMAKLYSEQVESILPGPLEAITATGATRMQTIIYAVVPQIIPPYISFTMYRWDINVRMSTIIGFAGGGGIGFLLQQNINLFNYRAASAQILAIAIVVATMDYVSSHLRERAI